MTKWAKSLIRISTYEVETLQKRLAEVGARRAAAEMRVAVLDAEREVETERARDDAEASTYMSAYLNGWRMRRASAEADAQAVAREEEGARDALKKAFESQKKFEHVAELSRLEALAAEGKRESAVLDDLAIRRAAG